MTTNAERDTKAATDAAWLDVLTDEDRFATLLIETVKTMVMPLAARLVKAEQELAAIKSGARLSYRGVWHVEQTYAEGNLATHAGSLWLAVGTTNGAPGTEASGWRLIVKRGQSS